MSRRMPPQPPQIPASSGGVRPSIHRTIATAQGHTMTTLHTAYHRVLATIGTRVLSNVRHRRRDRGDVPGWVLITVMTAGLVSALWIIAGPALTEMFTNSLASVTGRK